MCLHLRGDAVELDAGERAEEHLRLGFVGHDQRLVLAVVCLVPFEEDGYGMYGVGKEGVFGGRGRGRRRALEAGITADVSQQYTDGSTNLPVFYLMRKTGERGHRLLVEQAICTSPTHDVTSQIPLSTSMYE